LTEDPPFPAPVSGQAHLRIMATTDLHVHITPYDYYADKPVETLGLARTAGLIERLRASSPNTLLVDNGDFLQGNPMGDYIAAVRGIRPGDLHPMIAAMNRVGYDAATLGNHEFNYGLDFLSPSLAAATFPIVTANVILRRGVTADLDETLLPPFVVLDRTLVDGAGEPHPIRIGVLGLLPPQIMIWDDTHLKGRLTSRDIVEAAEAWVPVMKAQGAQIIVALCHSGIGAPRPEPGMENSATALAALPGIDVVIAGHSHLTFPAPGFADMPGVDVARGTLCGKPAVMAGCFGAHLGLIDLLLDRSPDGWRIAASRSEARLVPSAPPNATERAVIAAVAADHQATLDHIRRPVGRTLVPLNSFFAVLPGNASLALVAEAQRWFVDQALRGGQYADLPLLSAVSPFKMGGRGGPEFYTDVPAGDLAMRHVADLYVYPNQIRAVLVTGAELQDWLERAAGVFNRLTPGLPDQPLLGGDSPASQFDVIHGVTWAADLSQPARFSSEGALLNPAARRITDLRHQGRPVAATDRFVIATNSYRAGGGGGFPGARGDSIILRGSLTNRDVLLRYLTETGTVAAQTWPEWCFLPLARTTALLESAPRAAGHLPLNGLRLEPAGPAPGGFARFRLHL
jgi:2',3'-cyclic-nucleotide 2'-phosphodiesterase / 3'-nucleotidase